MELPSQLLAPTYSSCCSRLRMMDRVAGAPSTRRSLVKTWAQAIMCLQDAAGRNATTRGSEGDLFSHVQPGHGGRGRSFLLVLLQGRLH